MRAFGTPAIRERMEIWHTAVRAMIDADLAIRLAERSGEGVDDGRRLAFELRPAEELRRDELHDAVNAELGQP